LKIAKWGQGAFLLICCALTGCEKLTDTFDSLENRINAAYPLPVKVNSLATTLSTEVADPEFAKAWASRLRARALQCGAKADIGRFDTREVVRSKLQDDTCFSVADKALKNWLSIRQMGWLLSLPPLVPFEEAKGSTPVAVGSAFVGEDRYSAGSNVLLSEQGERNQIRAIALPENRVLSKVEYKDVLDSSWVSTNGRLVALNFRNYVDFYNVSTGDFIWRSEDARRVVADLPGLHLAVLQREPYGELRTLNLISGEIEDHPTAGGLGEAHLISASESELFLVCGGIFTRFSYSRDASTGRITANPVAQWPTVRTADIKNAVMTEDKKRVVYATKSGVSWLDLTTGAVETIDFLNATVGPVVKLNNDEFLISVRNGSQGTSVRLLNIDRRTIARVPSLPDNSQLQSFESRATFGRRLDGTLTLERTASAVDPIPIDQFLAEVHLREQLKKLQESQLANERISVPAGVVAPPSALMKDIPANATVHVIGVYEGQKAVAAAPGGNGHPIGTVRVRLKPANTPIVLVLTSYEPVSWVIESNGRTIAAVLLSGYHPSQVIGEGTASVVRIGQNHAYQVGSPGFRQIEKDIARYTTNPVALFQGTYSGSEFSVK
jgi:hypothetical protein